MYYVNIFIHSLYIFAVLVILKVQVHLYRLNNYWLCVVCINFGSSWVIDRLLLQVHGFGTVFVLRLVDSYTCISKLRRTSKRTFVLLDCSAL